MYETFYAKSLQTEPGTSLEVPGKIICASFLQGIFWRLLPWAVLFLLPVLQIAFSGGLSVAEQIYPAGAVLPG